MFAFRIGDLTILTGARATDRVGLDVLEDILVFAPEVAPSEAAKENVSDMMEESVWVVETGRNWSSTLLIFSKPLL